jgi:hypothetical protein
MNNLLKISLITLSLLSTSSNAWWWDKKEMPELDTTETLGGVDADADGLRDDIKVWIDTLAVNNDQKQAITDSARAMQAILLVDLNNSRALNNVSGYSMMTIVCLLNTFVVGNNLSPKQQNTIFRNIEDYTVNTPLRHDKYDSYNQSRSGSVSTLPNCGDKLVFINGKPI